MLSFRFCSSVSHPRPPLRSALSIPHLPLSLGSEASWEIDITTGSEGVNDITVDETLPAPSGIVWATDSTGCTLGTVSGGVQMLACDLDLPANSFAAVVVTTTPTALMCETLNFTVSVTLPGQEPLSDSLSDVVDCPALAVTSTPTRLLSPRQSDRLHNRGIQRVKRSGTPQRHNRYSLSTPRTSCLEHSPRRRPHRPVCNFL